MLKSLNLISFILGCCLLVLGLILVLDDSFVSSNMLITAFVILSSGLMVMFFSSISMISEKKNFRR